jgi:hypothetical protein
VRSHRERDRFLVEPFGAGRTTDTSAVFLTRVLRDSLDGIGGPAGEQLSGAIGEARDEFSIDRDATFRLTLAAPHPNLGIFKAFGYGQSHP